MSEQAELHDNYPDASTGKHKPEPGCCPKWVWVEHEKVIAAKRKGSQEVGEFCDWLQLESGFTICRHDSLTDQFMPARETTMQLVAEFYGVDLAKVEEEKRQMLEVMRRASKG